MAEAAAAAPRVELRGISKHFGATAALTDVSMDLRAGEVHGLVGENGAGKSTLVKILGGVHAPDAGTILLDGAPTHDQRSVHGPRARASRWCTRSPSCSRTCPSPRTSSWPARPRGDWGRSPGARCAGRRAPCSSSWTCASTWRAPVRGLSMADQQLIEIAKALSVDARVLVLDEPTASLSAHEVERLFTIVRRTRDRGVAVLFVSHRLDEVFALCDRATVLRDGRHVVTAATATLTTADLVRHMVGRAVTLFPKGEAHIGEILLEARGLAGAGAFRDVSFSVRSGEILGLRRPRGCRAHRDRAGPVRDRAPDGGRDPAGRPRRPLGIPGGGPPGGHRLCPGGPPPGRPRPRLLDRGEHDPPDPRPPLPPPVRAARHRADARPRVRGASPGAHDGRRPARPGTLGRQPAEGRDRQVAGHEPAGADPRRAHPRGGHRGQGGGPPDRARSSPPRAWRSS